MAADDGGIIQSPNQDRLQIAIAVHERANENAHHSDIIIWEVTSIIWGANTLLLGFILEAIDDSHARPLIIATSIIGIFLTVFVAHFVHLAKIGQHTAYRMCQNIEQEFQLEFRLHCQLHAKYETPGARSWFYSVIKGRAQTWVRLITGLFLGVWLFTGVWAVYVQFFTKSQN
jgi:hypothetical protein